MDAASLFHAEVIRFKRWAATVPDSSKFAEWEVEYPEWRALWEAAKHLIETTPVVTWTEATTEEVFYALARDNECEFIADALGAKRETLLAVAARVISSAEVDAKWQIAAQLEYQREELKERAPEAEAFLIRLMQDEDEYVQRRALIALGKMHSEKTEMFAERAWQTGHEYQRIAALWALKNVGSPKLAEYLQKAEEDGRKYLAQNATEIRAA